MKKIVGITCFAASLAFLAFGIACGCGSPTIARATRVQADLHVIATQLETYHEANGVYPSTQQGLAALLVKPNSSPIPSRWRPLFEQMPKDPWQNDYVYRQPGSVRPKYDLFSAGPDNKADTTDDIWIK